MNIKYFATESMGTELREVSASYVHECFLNGSGVIRAQYPDSDVEYIAGTRYGPAPLRWERRYDDSDQRHGNQAIGIVFGTQHIVRAQV